MNKRDNIKFKAVGGLIISAVFVLVFLSACPAQDKIVSMDFQEAPLKDVLKVFSQQSGMNFVASQNIEAKRITLYLDKVTVKDALDAILKANNLAYEQAQGSAVFVVIESGKPALTMETRIYTLNFARTSRRNAAQGSSSSASGGTTTSDSQSTAQVTDIKAIIEGLLTKGADGRPMGSVIVDNRTNSIIITSIAGDFPVIENAISKLDEKTPQVLIETEIVEINTTALKNLGLEWGKTNDGTFVTFTGPTRQTDFPFERRDGPFQKSLMKYAPTALATKGLLDLSDFQMVLKALEKEGCARYLAKPKILVLNNESAEIRISADAAVGLITTSEPQTQTTTEEAERYEIGVILKVTPTINKQGYVTMTLEPEVSRTILSKISGESQVFYDPTKRSAKTTVMVKDEQTIAIGGLLASEETDNNRAVPGASKVPLFGKLFKSSADEKTNTEIVIFVKTHIMKDDDELAKAGASKQSQAEAQAVDAEVQEATQEAQEPAKSDAALREEEIKNTVARLKKERELKQ